MSSIAIIDYGMGNLHSITKAIEHVAGRERVIVSQLFGGVGTMVAFSNKG